MTVVKEEKKETAELLIELYSEEIPWNLQEPMTRKLEKFLQEELVKALGLQNTENTFGERRVYWTPRRVAVGIADVPVRSEAWEEERRGPRVNSPQVAIDGFLRANGLKTTKECRRVADAKKGDYWAFTVRHIALSLSELLEEVVVRVIGRMAKELPVRMRFGKQNFRWVRPLRHITAVFAGKGVKGALELGNKENLSFTRKTRGHPFASSGTIVVTGIQDYEDKLRKNYVEPIYQKRFDEIFENVAGNSVYDYKAEFPRKYRLLQENACLTEYPIVFKGHFDEEFNDLPSFLINTVLSEHQKMIRDSNVKSGDGEFFIITNIPYIKQKQEKNNIIKGFERVVRARLADAKFMWERDKKTPIEEFINKLQNIIFHPKLKTIADKNQRTKRLIPVIVETLKNNNDDPALDSEYDPALFERQVDELNFGLATETVREFPSLQKSISRELIDNKFKSSASISRAIVGIANAADIADIADNIDTLVSLWSVGEKPTGSGDPFALRRYALGTIFALKNISLPLKGVFESTLEILSTQHVDDSPFYGESRELLLKEIVSFILERLRVFIKDHEQLPHDCIEAVLTHDNAQECNIHQIYYHTIKLAKEIDNNNPLAEIFYRLHAILRPYSDDFSSFTSPPSPDLFSATEERNLHARTHQLLAESAWQNLTFTQKLQTLGSLKDAVDPFFDHVLVIDKHENIRQNRLRLLYSIYRRFLELADFTKIHHKDKQQKDKQQKNKQQ